jgi:methionyl-tRNA formyltransferase
MTKIVFMGSPDFSLPGLRALAAHYQVVGVVTQPDRASGRGRELKSPPVKTLALELDLPLIQPEKLRQPEAMEQLGAWSPDLIVVAASTCTRRCCRAGAARRRSMPRFWQATKRPV